MSADNVTIKVEFRRNDANPATFHIYVALQSEVRPGLSATNEISPRGKTPAELLKLVETAGGGLAEYLGEKYGDNIDPSTAAGAARVALVGESQGFISCGTNRTAIVARVVALEAELQRRLRLPKAGVNESQAVHLMDEWNRAFGLKTLLTHAAGVDPLPNEVRWLDRMYDDLKLVGLL